MNNNRGNNRRRGRGNNRQQGGQQLNRIDSRARGNAPQLLEKYRKLAHDSHLNGDRVQEEYYLQFADHYFRVIADQRQRQDEARLRREDRYQDGGDCDRDDEPRNTGGDAEYDYNRREAVDIGDDEVSLGDQDGGDRSPYEPADNPFVRDNRSVREARRHKPRRDARADDEGDEEREEERPSQSVDPSVLPPSIGASAEPADGDDEPEAERKPRRRTRRQRPEGESGETLESVG